jgi:flagellar motility protein MotE (MotC chaperone)
MESNLTAILNYYAYLFLALDFDSFAENGGDPYFERLKQIVQMAQSSGEKGWKAFEDNKNRSAVLSAYTDPATSQMRQLTYRYHRRGLDEMATSVDKGRATITESLATLKKVYDVAPMSVGLSMFKDAKLDELVNVYSKAPAEERQNVYELLQPLYPTEQQRLEQLRKGYEKK